MCIVYVFSLDEYTKLINEIKLKLVQLIACQKELRAIFVEKKFSLQPQYILLRSFYQEMAQTETLYDVGRHIHI